MAHPDTLLGSIHKEDISTADCGAYAKSTYYFTSIDFYNRHLRIINLKMKDGCKAGRAGLIFHTLILFKRKKLAINLDNSHVM